MTDIEYVTSCFSCAQGLFAECLDPLETPDGNIIPCAVRFRSTESSGAGGGALAPSEVTDAKSTGRKRAVMIAPILDGMLCEWAGLRQAGGGVIPIVGCAGNQLSDKQKGNPEQGWRPGALHHGPDKNTLNNSPGTNLHRICALCHNRWHGANDPFYGERPTANVPFTPVQPYYLHDPNTEATVEEQEAAELWWSIKKKEKRGPYPVEPDGLRKIVP